MWRKRVIASLYSREAKETNLRREGGGLEIEEAELWRRHSGFRSVRVCLQGL